MEFVLMIMFCQLIFCFGKTTLEDAVVYTLFNIQSQGPFNSWVGKIRKYPQSFLISLFISSSFWSSGWTVCPPEKVLSTALYNLKVCKIFDNISRCGLSYAGAEQFSEKLAHLVIFNSWNKLNSSSKFLH